MTRRTPSAASKFKQGRGAGHGKAYKPYLTVRDVPSRGQRNRIKGWKSERAHHFLSDNEKRYFYVLEWAPFVVDIREQFPLPLGETVEIARRLGIKHPTNRETKELQVMTTDFLVDELVDNQRTVKARTVKPADELNSKREIEKLEIERTYWNERGIDWGIAVDLDIPEALAKNVEWVHDALDPELTPKLPYTAIPQVEQVLFSILMTQPDLPLSHAALGVDYDLGLKPGTCLWVVRHLIATRQWCVDMFSPIDTAAPLIVGRSQDIMQSEGRVDV